jgi:TRAP-type C4-dicarboxylate transport system permease small subunit
MRLVNGAIFVVSSLALVIAALVLTEGVLARNLWGDSSEWQEEVTVFLLLGAMFLSMASVQARRGHIGIDALTGLLPAGLDRGRRLVVDAVSLGFVGFFAWKCFQLLKESIVEDAHTMSTWGPPLWIPYSLMTAGMALLAIQIALQVLGALQPNRGGART